MNPPKTAFMNVAILFLSFKKKWRSYIALFAVLLSFIASYAGRVEHFFAPTDSVGFTGSTTFCQGENLLLTANFVPAGSTLLWQVSTNGGASWTDIGTNPTYNATTSGLYTVVVTTGGVPTNWPIVNITVNPVPAANYNFT